MSGSRAQRRSNSTLPALAAIFTSAAAGCFPEASEFQHSSKAFVVNATRAALDVRVQAFAGELDCERVDGAAGENLARELFEPEATYDVPPGGLLPLDIEPSASRWQPFDTIETCGAKVVQVLGIPDQLVFWPEYNEAVLAREFAATKDPALRAQSVIVEGTEGVLGATAGDRLEVSEIGPVGALDGLREPPRPFDWSGTFPQGDAVITRKAPLPDGCSSLGVRGADQTNHDLFLCAPSWAFPFEVGDTVVFEIPSARQESSATKEPPPGKALVVTDTHVPARRTLQMWLGVSYVPLATSTVQQGASVTRPCGARSSDLELTMAGFPALFPGQEGERITPEATTRVLLGRAEVVFVASTRCEPERARLGYSVDALQFTETSDP
jgi:hypothetical protein